jgi:hypothetical protein
MDTLIKRTDEEERAVENWETSDGASVMPDMIEMCDPNPSSWCLLNPNLTSDLLDDHVDADDERYIALPGLQGICLISSQNYIFLSLSAQETFTKLVLLRSDFRHCCDYCQSGCHNTFYQLSTASRTS